MSVAALIYALCALTSATCFVLLWRGFSSSHSRLLFWSALCFALLTVNNVLLVIDKIVFPAEVDLRMWRVLVALLAVCVLLYGLIMDDES